MTTLRPATQNPHSTQKRASSVPSQRSTGAARAPTEVSRPASGTAAGTLFQTSPPTSTSTAVGTATTATAASEAPVAPPAQPPAAAPAPAAQRPQGNRTTWQRTVDWASRWTPEARSTELATRKESIHRELEVLKTRLIEQVIPEATDLEPGALFRTSAAYETLRVGILGSIDAINALVQQLDQGTGTPLRFSKAVLEQVKDLQAAVHEANGKCTMINLVKAQQSFVKLMDITIKENTPFAGWADYSRVGAQTGYAIGRFASVPMAAIAGFAAGVAALCVLSPMVPVIAAAAYVGTLPASAAAASLLTAVSTGGTSATVLGVGIAAAGATYAAVPPAFGVVGGAAGAATDTVQHTASAASKTIVKTADLTVAGAKTLATGISHTAGLVTAGARTLASGASHTAGLLTYVARTAGGIIQHRTPAALPPSPTPAPDASAADSSSTPTSGAPAEGTEGKAVKDDKK